MLESRNLLYQMLTVTSLSSLGVPIGHALLIDKLRNDTPKLAFNVSPDAVINAGPLALQSLTSSPAVLQELRQAWVLAVSQVNVLLVVIICISYPQRVI